MKFKMGAKDAIPIALGYFAVSIAFGVAAVTYKFPWWSPIIISMTNLTGSGQAVGIELLSVATTTLAELFVTMLAINIRYALMSVTMSQRLAPNVTIGQRCLMAFGMTDENFAVAISKNREITFGYMMGLIAVSYSGWVGGTIVGALAGNFLPSIVLTAFGIALPAMFLAIIVPPCRKSLASVIVIGASIAFSCIFYFVPVVKELSKGWVYIICGLVSALIGALFFPVKDEENTVKAEAAVKEESGAAAAEIMGKAETPFSDNAAGMQAEEDFADAASERKVTAEEINDDVVPTEELIVDVESVSDAAAQAPMESGEPKDEGAEDEPKTDFPPIGTSDVGILDPVAQVSIEATIQKEAEALEQNAKAASEEAEPEAALQEQVMENPPEHESGTEETK